MEIPQTVNEVKELNRSNGNTFWQDAIKKEYDNVKVVFKLINEEDGKKVPPAYAEITCHLIFEVMFDLRRKAHYSGGNLAMWQVVILQSHLAPSCI